MTIDSEARRAALAPLERARTLPPSAYTDPAFWEREVECVFRREWHCVGRIEQVARPGDYFSVDLVGEPVVVVRDKAGELRALSRICRHRWAPVVEGHGNRSSFQCPYHLWTFGLDGRLIGAPEMNRAEGFEKDAVCLPGVRVETWQGFVFVNLDPDATALAPQLAGLDAAIADWNLGEMVSVHTMEYQSTWNWKVMVENFSESYHHAGPHAQTLQPIFPATGTWHADSDGPWLLLHNPEKPGLEGEAGGLPAIPTLTPEQRGEFLVVAVFPYCLFALLPSSAVWFEMRLHGADRHDLRIHQLVPPAARETEDFEKRVDAMARVTDAIHREDIEICSAVQRGLRGRLAATGRYSHLEKGLWQFNRWLLERL